MAADGNQVPVSVAVDTASSIGPFREGSALSFIPQTPPEDVPPDEGPAFSSAAQEAVSPTVPQAPDAGAPAAAAAAGAVVGGNESQSISHVPIGSGLGIGLGSAGGRRSPPSVLPKKDDEDEEFLALKRPRPPPKMGKISFNVEGAKQAVAAAQAVKEAEEAVEALRAKRMNTRDACSQTEADPLRNGDYVALWRLRPRGMASFPHFPRQVNGKKQARDRKPGAVSMPVSTADAEVSTDGGAAGDPEAGGSGKELQLPDPVEAESGKVSATATNAVIDVDEGASDSSSETYSTSSSESSDSAKDAVGDNMAVDGAKHDVGDNIAVDDAKDAVGDNIAVDGAKDAIGDNIAVDEDHAATLAAALQAAGADDFTPPGTP